MTEFETIYAEFLDKITDYNMVLYEDSLKKETLKALLKKACTRFEHVCVIELSYDDDLDQFNKELSLTELDIITTWMIYFWITPYVNNSDNLENILNTKDFTEYSPANLTSTLKSVQKESLKEARSLMNEYSILNGDHATLKPR